MYKNLKQSIKVNETKLTKLKEKKRSFGDFSTPLSLIEELDEIINANLKKILNNTVNLS